YTETALAGVPPALRQRWFKRAPGQNGKAWSVAEELQQLVAFRELNLIGHWPMKGKFQAIFCRNVVIYFEEQTQSLVWSRFTPLLAPGGVLYIGHSERLSGPAASAFNSEGVTTYRLRQGVCR
ncbi:MAG: CheR family methyltransferase, partial [Hyphomicrobiales bacterium]